MSVLYKGEIIDSNLTRNAKGGTEQMRSRLLQNIDKKYLEKVAIHFSRPEKLYDDVPNILYCHDLPDDPAVSLLHDSADRFETFVFVSHWQRDQFVSKFPKVTYAKSHVIPNAIETEFRRTEKPKDQINFIYHTTPHRGLQLVYPIFDKLSEIHENIHLDVYSSFDVYGWKERDKPYEKLFEDIAKHPKMTYHGAKENSEVIEALKKSHLFLYPCIWQETSCIALIEAMHCGVLPIYPSYSALVETGSFSSNVGMHRFTEDFSQLASISFQSAHNLINRINEDKQYVEETMNNCNSSLNPHSISYFRNKWEPLLRDIQER